ncbi:hypothetical protein MCAP1_002507 [Malassezia caprae]|uniref:CCZ1/INTU/HSP4 first Longin domain-containing protein n=1 Tax=Malassezia caprae TaxID=1381934 RepID=A0AAF0E739_9BASI|nr:hypothetical protein MCAP1_002507 [Malassezia caprae]
MDGWRARLWRASRADEAHYEPAQVQYLVIFSPRLTEHLDAEDPERLAGQILYYTDIEQAVSQVQTMRQVALANALIDFATSMQADAGGAELRTLAVGTTARRLYLIEVAPDLWLHACVALAHVRRGENREPKPWCNDSWMQQQLQDAWQAWRLEHGAPHSFWRARGRDALEQSLERFFSKWVWQWDVERQWAPVLHASPPPRISSGLLAETCATLDACPDMSEDDLVQALAWFARTSQQRPTEAPTEMLLLYDDKVLWPQPHAAREGGLDAQARRQVARYVLRRLVGLETARREAATAFAARPPAEKPRPPPTNSEQTAPSAWFDLPFMADVSGSAPLWLGLDALWPKSRAAQDEMRVAEPEAPEAPAAGTSRAAHAFHARLEHALGDEATSRNESPAADTAVSELQEITQAYATTQAAAGGARRRREAPPAPKAERPQQRSTAWYTAMGAACQAHDVRLDGWGAETPVPWHEAQLYVGGPDRVPLTDGGASDSDDAVDVVYTTRQLLTMVLLWPRGATDADARASWLAPGWELLRRVQRCLNDKQRKSQAAQSEEAEPPSFVHMDTPSALCWRQLPGPPLSSGMEAQLLTSQAWLTQHGLTETLARAEDGSFWVAAPSVWYGRL